MSPPRSERWSICTTTSKYTYSDPTEFSLVTLESRYCVVGLVVTRQLLSFSRENGSSWTGAIMARINVQIA